MRLPTYPSYKPSGVEWLGDVPEHWTAKPLGRLVRFQGGATPDKGNPEYWDGEIPWVSPKDMKQPRIADVPDHVSLEALRHSPLKVVPVGSVLIVVRGMILAHSFPVAISVAPLTINQDMKALAAGDDLEPEFLFWLLTGTGRVFVSLADESAHGTRKLESEIVSKVGLSIPPPDEQRTIAGLLDRETAKIDTLVSKKRTLSERLNEKRTALISRTVTRGLPPDAARAAGFEPHPKLKPSGIDWIGDVPEHWEVAPVFRRATAIQTGPFGSQLHEADYVEGGIPLVNPAHIVSGRFAPDELSAVDEKTAERLGRHRLRPGDIVLGRRGEMGRCGVVTETESGWLCGTGALVVRLDHSDPRYFVRVFSSSGFSTLLELNAVGTTMLNLNPAIVGRMLVPMPPLNEQTAIADYLDRETAAIDRLVGKVETAIERLLEYRSALITAAVTGKIDVRGRAPMGTPSG